MYYNGQIIGTRISVVVKKSIRSGKPTKFRIPQRNKLNIETKATTSGESFPHINNAI
jgi:hypothetical protein